jgi:GNAT superfamily N-acetyltransferase/predicted GNAT family N-acyltransferase
VDIRPVDPHRPEETGFAGTYAVFRDALLADRPWATLPSAEEVLAHLQHDDPTEKAQWFAAFDGDRVVGSGHAFLPLADNLKMTWLGVCVAPPDRRQGFGTAIARHLFDYAAEHGRTLLLAETSVPAEAGDDHAHRAFYRSLGFELANTEIVRHLQLPVADDLLTRLLDDAKPHFQDAYTIETYTDGIPDDLLPSYCAANNRLVTDAPTGSIEFEEMSLTPELYKSYLEVDRRLNTIRITALGLTADRDVAAYTDLHLPASNPDRAHQWGTLVTAEHRGHRLGTAVKVANLQELQRSHPDRRIVGTQNAENNSYMVSINVALGFEVVELAEMVKQTEKPA